MEEEIFDLNKVITDRNAVIEDKIKEMNLQTVSISEIKESLQPEFEKDRMALQCSARDKYKPNGKYYGMSPDDIIAMWEEKAAKSRDNGKMVDAYIGNSYDGKLAANKMLRLDYGENKVLIKKFNEIDHALASFKEKGFKFVSREMPLEIPVTMDDGTVVVVTGRFDGVFEKDGTFLVVDWKNDEKIDMTSNFKMLGPCFNIVRCKWNLYSIQLGMYRHIFKVNYQIGQPILTYICDFPAETDDEYKLIKTNDSIVIDDPFFQKLVNYTYEKRKILLEAQKEQEQESGAADEKAIKISEKDLKDTTEFDKTVNGMFNPNL